MGLVVICSATANTMHRVPKFLFSVSLQKNDPITLFTYKSKQLEKLKCPSMDIDCIDYLDHINTTEYYTMFTINELELCALIWIKNISLGKK